VYTSAPLTKHDRLSPLLESKRATERELESSGLDHVIFRASIFMDTAFAMMGSEIPLRGSEGATVLRPFAFANRQFARIKHSIEQKGVAMIPGDGTSRHAFICVDDVAEFLAAAAVGGPCSGRLPRPYSGAYDLGAPDALTFVDVVHLNERIVDRTIAVKRTPAGVFRAMRGILNLFSPAAANLMALNHVAAIESTAPDGWATAAFGVRLTSAEDFLRAKAATAAAG